MKKNYFLALLLCVFYNVNAQITDVVNSGLNGPINLTLVGNEIYVVEFTGNRISKFNVLDAVPTTITNVISGLNGPQGIVLNGNDLYISESVGGRISKIDITDASPTLTTVISGLGYPIGMVISGNDLYVTELNTNRVSKIDITLANPIREDFITGLNGPTGLALDGNDLYIVEQPGGRVSKADITALTPVASTVVTGLSGSYALTLSDHYLFISEYLGNTISKVNTTASLPTSTSVVESNINGPAGTYMYNNELFIAELNTNKITKIIPQTLNVAEVELSDDTLFIYPNPSKSVIKLMNNGNKHLQYKIFSALGLKINEGILNNDEIEINHLKNGIYYIQLENDKTFKFIKK